MYMVYDSDIFRWVCDLLNLLIHFSGDKKLRIPMKSEETFTEMWQKIVDLLCDKERGHERAMSCFLALTGKGGQGSCQILTSTVRNIAVHGSREQYYQMNSHIECDSIPSEFGDPECR